MNVRPIGATDQVAISDTPAVLKLQGVVAQGAIDTVPGSTATTFSVSVGGSQSGVVNSAGDLDWYRITLVAGQKYTFNLSASGTSPLTDPYLRLHNESGVEIAFNDDGGGGLNSRIVFDATVSGTYYLSAGGFDNSASGNYTLSAATFTPPPVFTLDQIAYQLTNEYWGGSQRAFVDADKIITFNVSGLTAEGAALARAALQRWDDVSALAFQEVTSGAQITFDDNQDDAFTNSTFTGSTILSSTVNVGLNWLGAYGTTTDSYSFQTYVHEIGHALGLGHGGNYNGNATYGVDNHYSNDSWSYSVMSYFDQAEAGLGSSRHLATVSMGDIVAIQNLYGPAAGTRTGDTVYGHNATAGAIYSFATYNTAPAFTIYDTGGIDTLDVSGYSDTQTISLVAEGFSSIGGLNNNIAIARGVEIENASGGSGVDSIVGNSVANVLHGNGGNDSIDGGSGNDTLYGDGGFDQLRGGAGNDTIYWDAGDDLANVLGGADFDTLVVSSASALSPSFNLESHGFEAVQSLLVTDGNVAVQVLSSYDAQGRLQASNTYHADGMRTHSDFDANSSQTWSYIAHTYDAVGRHKDYNLFVDDGSRFTVYYDYDSTRYFTDQTDRQDQQLRLIDRNINHDDGTRTTFYYDYTSTQSYIYIVDRADTLGRVLDRNDSNDDGTRLTTYFDVANSQTWQYTTYYFNAVGVQTAVHGLNDDGSLF